MTCVARILFYNRLNICVLQNSHVETQSLMWRYLEVGSFRGDYIMGSVPLWKRIQRAPLLLLPWGHGKKTVNEPGSELSPICWCLNLGFPGNRTEKYISSTDKPLSLWYLVLVVKRTKVILYCITGVRRWSSGNPGRYALLTVLGKNGDNEWKG